MSVKTKVLNLSALFTAGFCFLVIAPSASAFSFSSNGDSVTIGTSDINKSFDISFDGNVSTQNVSGLSSKATFTFLGFSQIGSGSKLETQALFNIALANTSSNGIASRTSALGFNVNDSLKSDTSVGGIFTSAVLGGSFPNQFGNIDVCFTQGNTCQGGKNGGVSTGGTSGTFSPTLAFSGSVNSFTLSNFGVRYQSITGTNLGTSGTGHGYYQAPPQPKKVPEPGTIAALGLLTIAGVLGLKKRNKINLQIN